MSRETWAHPYLPRFYTVNGLQRLAAVFDQEHDCRITEHDTWTNAAIQADQLNEGAGLDGLDRPELQTTPDVPRESLADRLPFAAASHAVVGRIDLAPFLTTGALVMRGSECAAVARSHTMAKRIAVALNSHKPNRKGV